MCPHDEQDALIAHNNNFNNDTLFKNYLKKKKVTGRYDL